tara:strand:+ start:436 stop:615 length:180 start_codon:yes stop_codon:yes gene_type:complete
MRYIIIKETEYGIYVEGSEALQDERDADKLCDALNETYPNKKATFRVVCLPEQKNLEVV